MKNTKNRVKRTFPTVPGSKVQKLLLEIRPPQRDLNTLVFTDESGNPLSSAVLQKVWNGHTSKINRREYVCLGVLKELVKKGSLPFYLKPYSTRHTFATWAITQGVSPDKVAQWIGDKVEIVLKYYCHPQVVEADCPDFQFLLKCCSKFGYQALNLGCEVVFSKHVRFSMLNEQVHNKLGRWQ